MAYESPIHLYMTDIQTQLIKKQEEQILKAVQSVAVGVDHDELFRALKYDREQYQKGYQDGKPKWIPVTERLPQELPKDNSAWSDFVRPSVDVLVKIKGLKQLYTAWYSYSHKIWTDVREEHSFKYVTHWMPLPEPPKEDL